MDKSGTSIKVNSILVDSDKLEVSSADIIESNNN